MNNVYSRHNLIIYFKITAQSHWIFIRRSLINSKLLHWLNWAFAGILPVSAQNTSALKFYSLLYCLNYMIAKLIFTRFRPLLDIILNSGRQPINGSHSPITSGIIGNGMVRVFAFRPIIRAFDFCMKRWRHLIMAGSFSWLKINFKL